MKHHARLLFIGALPLAAASGSFACSDDDARQGFEAPPDAAGDSIARLPEASAPGDDAGAVDARAPVDASDEPIVCTAKPCVTQLAGGGGHFCALLEDKTVHCWGSAYLALGIVDGGNAPNASQPRPRSMGVSGVEQLSAANSTTCARLTDGTVKCWGGNQDNVLGLHPPRTDYVAHDPAPVAIEGGVLGGVTRVDVAAAGAVFATKTSGELWSWGDNAGHVLGRMNEGSSYLGPGPVTDLLGEKVRRGGGGSNNSGIGFAITEKGRLLTWGTSKQANAYPGPIPVAVTGLENVSSASALGDNICAVADGRLYCWGLYGRMACTGSPDGSLTPVEIRTRGTAHAQQVSLYYENTCVRLTDGTVECCGSGSLGQLATGAIDAGAPASAPLLTKATALTGRAVQVVVGLSASCALVQGGTVQCWGGNAQGQLGRGTQDSEAHPIPMTVTFD